MKNKLSSIIIIFCIIAISTNRVFATPSIISSTSVGSTIKFIATLNEKLPTGYTVKIDYGNGKGPVAMTCSLTICSLSSNTFPAGVSLAIYKVGIYNAKNILQGNLIANSYVIQGSSYLTPSVSSNSTTINSTSNSTSTYTKLSTYDVAKLANVNVAKDTKVILYKSGCRSNFIAIGTLGFSILEWYGGYDPLEGDIIVGNISGYGMKDITYTNGRTGRIYVNEYMETKDNVLKKYNNKCL
jgi:hypothetical protein